MPPEWEPKQDRISILARPKVNHQVLFCRPTVYWVDKIPKEQPRFTFPVLTPRQEELSQFKRVNPSYRYERSFPEQSVTCAALKVVASPRIKELAQPRPFTDISELNNPTCHMVSKGALNAVPTPRIIALARPKSSPSTSDKPHKKHGPVPRAEKFEELSRPRIYIFEGHNPYIVSKAALKYHPSPRILEISRPVKVQGRIT